MAFIQQRYCPIHSQKEDHLVDFLNGKCRKCIEAEYKKRDAAWKSQTIEEKLYDLHKRLEKLERGPIIY